ncbi:SRPBCC family protein [Ruania halotolerans]|uniref:SRPBCC family protein n=1 Tax=Ruania halotolerans TaxID=2897773 RepID=UPI001E36D71C|nr:SRPBCC family protein [Ruania halotolerans]UFU08192.1 SRPBCC family protein [Ruania halotolerans]
MSTVEESVDVNVPITTVYNQWTQFEDFPEFMDGVVSVTQIDDRHNHWVTEVGGQQREFDTEITEQHPDERIAWTSTSGEVDHGGVVTFHRLSDSVTRVMVQIDWAPQGVAEKVGAAVGADAHRVKADTKRFKAFIEDRQRATGAWPGDVDTPS